MGLNDGCRDLIEVILDPADSGNVSIDQVLSGQRVKGKRRQGEELARLWSLLRVTQPSYVIEHPDDVGRFRRDSGVVPNALTKNPPPHWLTLYS